MNLDIFVTTDCNMKCSFCGSWKQNEAAAFIPLERVFEMLDAGKDYGFKFTTLSGGEPFLHKDIFDIIDYADKKGYWCNLTTNGLLIDENTITKLKNKKVNIRVSLHTLDRKLHEKMTGSDTLDKVLDAIKLLRDRRQFYSIGATIFEDNVNEIGKLAEFAFDAGSSFIRFTPVVSVFKGSNIKLDKEFYQEMLCNIISTAIKYKKFLNYSKGNDIFISDPIDIITTRRCPAGSNLFMIIDTTEIIIPCQFMPMDYDFPRIKFESIKDLSAMKTGMDRIFSDEMLNNLQGECGKCAYKAVCFGGCIGSKVTKGLALTDDQPICIRDILKKVLPRFDRKDINDLIHYWYYHYNQRISMIDSNRSCVRKLPIWELNFKFRINLNKENYHDV